MCHFCLVTGTTVTIKPDCFAREVPHLDGMRKIDGVMEEEGQMKFALLVVGGWHCFGCYSFPYLYCSLYRAIIVSLVENSGSYEAMTLTGF